MKQIFIKDPTRDPDAMEIGKDSQCKVNRMGNHMKIMTCSYLIEMRRPGAHGFTWSFIRFCKIRAKDRAKTTKESGSSIRYSIQHAAR